MRPKTIARAHGAFAATLYLVAVSLLVLDYSVYRGYADSDKWDQTVLTAISVILVAGTSLYVFAVRLLKLLPVRIVRATSGYLSARFVAIMLTVISITAVAFALPMYREPMSGLEHGDQIGGEMTERDGRFYRTDHGHPIEEVSADVYQEWLIVTKVMQKVIVLFLVTASACFVLMAQKRVRMPEVQRNRRPGEGEVAQTGSQSDLSVDR